MNTVIVSYLRLVIFSTFCELYFIRLCHAPVGWGHYAVMTVVCLSVCSVSDPKSRPEGRSKMKIGRHGWLTSPHPWPH